MVYVGLICSLWRIKDLSYMAQREFFQESKYMWIYIKIKTVAHRKQIV